MTSTYTIESTSSYQWLGEYNGNTHNSCAPKLHSASRYLTKVSLLMNSSLNWRCRYVVAIEPSKKDLDANHPLFVVSRTRNVFQRLWREREKKDGGGKRPAKRARTVNNENTSSKAGGEQIGNSTGFKRSSVWYRKAPGKEEKGETPFGEKSKEK